MDAPHPIPLTPEQIAALEGGNVFVHAEDPATSRRYLLIEQVEPTLDEKYIQEKLVEGTEDFEAGRVSDWDPEAAKAQVRERHEARNTKS